MNTVNTCGLIRCRSSLAMLSALMLLASNLVRAATITSQTTGGNWSDPATWVGGVVPVAGDVVVIPATNSSPVFCDVFATCFSLSVNPNCQLNIADDTILTVTGTPIINGALAASSAPGTITTGAGNSKLLLAGTANQSFTGSGTYGNLEISNLVGSVQAPTTVGLSIATNCTLTVDSGAFLQQVNNTRSFVGGDGNFVLADGATLGIKDAAGITPTGGGTNGFIRVTGTRTFSTNANYIYNGTTPQTTGTGLPAVVNSLIITNAANFPTNFVTLANSVTVSGATMISDGTLVAGSSLNIAAGATFDVSGLGASATYTFGGSATLVASGTNTLVGVSAAAINGGASGTVSLGSQPITLTYDGSHPALYISQGTLSLNGNAFIVNTAAPLTNGTYTIIQQASGNITSNGIFSVSGTAIGSGVSGAIQVSGSNVILTVASPKLTITFVNGGVNPTAGTAFSIVVQAQSVSGTPVNLLTDTTVTISRASGTGTLGGTLTGTIFAGSSSVTISGVTYTKAESGVVLTATRTSGDTLVAGTSAAFTVIAGAATTLTLTSGNNQSKQRSTLLTSPFVVTVTDANANPVSAISVAFAIATVPSGATGQSLSTTSTTTAANGQASSTLTLGNVAGTYTVTAASTGLTGSPVTFTATATAGNYIVLAAATNEYQICFKCHTAYSWGATPPNGNSPNGSAANPLMTDVAQEFSPKNLSGHPITTGLNNYSNSKAPKALLAAALKAPWNVNVGTQTMMCSDCHDATTTNYVASAAQRPHGSANQYILRGPNAANWPNVTSFATSWCANCHNDNLSMDGHANHHSTGGCNTCHVVIPHGSKMSRLMADEDGVMPARYALNSSKTTTTVHITSFTKSSSTSYGESACRTDCGHHSSGSSTTMENW